MNKAVPGQKHIPAADWNELRDFMNNYTPQNGGMVNNPLNPFFVYVQNDTSDDLPAFSVVRLDGTIYPQRSAADTKDAALNQLLEISGDTPTGELNENIGILQEDVEAGQLGKAVVVGASLCYVQVDNANTAYKFAKSINSAEKLQADESEGQVRIVWKEAGTGKKLAYVILDQTGTPTPETFLIKASTNPTASDYVKGNLAYIIWSSSDSAWIPINSFSDNVEPGKVRLVVCQEDLPSSLTEDYLMPYYPLEDNIGVTPNKSTASGESFTDRCGVAPGEHVLSNKRFDYCFKYGRYAYEPKFVLQTQAEAHLGGNTGVYVTINGNQYSVEFPSGVGAGNINLVMRPDVYAGDTIAVEVETNLRYPNNTYVFALSYPVDYQEHTVLILPYGNPGWRGWQDVTTDYIPANNPSPNYSESLMFVKHWGNSSVINSCAAADARQQFGIFELGLMFYKKIKTNALI